MIKASELRIGNIIASGVVFSDTSLIGRVLSIGSLDCEFEQIYCECEESFEWFMRDNYCGIPLTPEILEKMGILKSHGTPWHRMGSFAVNPYICGGLVEWKNTAIGERPHLHELQNLYFALTGTELDVTQILKP